MKKVLTIAGSDSSGGAGIQADLKTMLAHGVFGMSAVTALTAQNTMGVRSIMEATPDFLAQELDAVFEDIRPDAVKIGMVSSVGLIEVIAQKLKAYKAGNVVVDPVMVATSGASLMKPDAVQVLKEELFPLAMVLTPNIPEMECLTGRKIQSMGDMEAAACEIGRAYHVAVLGKGGHFDGCADDVLFSDEACYWYRSKRIDNRNTHGTGCTLSSAIASNLAKGYNLQEAVGLAKDYLTGALAAQLDLGSGCGPVSHGYALQGKYTESEKNGETQL